MIKSLISSNNAIDILKVMIGAIMIGFSSVYVKFADVSASVSGFYRMLFGGIILLIIVAIKKERLWNGWKYLGLSLLVALAFTGDLFSWHQSILFIGPGLATILVSFQVFILGIYGVLVLKEKANAKLLLSLPLAMAGLFLIMGVDWAGYDDSFKIGIYLGFASAGFYAAYILLLRKAQSDKNALSPIVNLAIISVFSTIILGVSAFYEGASFDIPNQKTLFSLLGYGIFSQVIGWTLISGSLPRINASLAGLMLMLQPTFSFIWDIVFFDLGVTLISLSGVVITLGAIYMGTLSQNKNDESSETA